MPPKGKSKAKAFKASSSSKILATIDPPKPFLRPSPKLSEFINKLSPQHVYITHIDTKPWDFKRKIFLVPVAMNVLIIASLIWRIRYIGWFYIHICFSLMGRSNETTIDTTNSPMDVIIRAILRRTVTFMIDLLIYTFIWPWPREFFAGRTNGNPIAWRFGVGFRDKEIIIRRSRKWDLSLGNILDKENTGTQILLDTIRRAVDPLWMNEKTGYLMLNREWDLDWKAIVQATKLVDTKQMDLEDFRTTIFVYHPEYDWMTIKTAAAGGSVKEEEDRRKIVAFKDELTALGKENLFFRWIELLQYESSRGEFGPEQRLKMMQNAKDMFEAQGVDFDKFWAKIGGMEGMPGLNDL